MPTSPRRGCSSPGTDHPRRPTSATFASVTTPRNEPLAECRTAPRGTAFVERNDAIVPSDPTQQSFTLFIDTTFDIALPARRGDLLENERLITRQPSCEFQVSVGDPTRYARTYAQ
jgi:hypothetical protein